MFLHQNTEETFKFSALTYKAAIFCIPYIFWLYCYCCCFKIRLLWASLNREEKLKEVSNSMLNRESRYSSIPSRNNVNTTNNKIKSKFQTSMSLASFLSSCCYNPFFFFNIPLSRRKVFASRGRKNNPYKIHIKPVGVSRCREQSCLSWGRIRTYSFLSYILIVRNILSDGSVLFVIWRQTA